jgi:hypothetical protein
MSDIEEKKGAFNKLLTKKFETNLINFHVDLTKFKLELEKKKIEEKNPKKKATKKSKKAKKNRRGEEEISGPPELESTRAI